MIPPATTAPVAVVTGATSGIGRWIALGLAQAGHHVVMVGRDPARGEAVATWIAGQAPAATTQFMAADLSSLAATRAVGQRIAAEHPALAVLVNNAGVFQARRERTAEGHDLVLAVNHLSPFLLTRELAAALRGGGSGRIVNVGSSTSDKATIDPDDLELDRRWSMVRAYSQSKLALIMTAFEWARRLAGTGVTVNVVHPGTVATSLVRTPGVIGLAWRVMALWCRTAQQGADTPLHAALAPELAGVTGAYLKDRRPARPNRRAEDAALVRRVWEATELLVKS